MSGGAGQPLWTSLELVRWTADYFTRAGIPSARLDAELLLAHALGCRRLDLYLQFERPIEEAERARYRELIQRRGRERVPVAQLVGEREFWSRAFTVSADVLVPRPETEILVQATLEGPVDRVLDFGTGSGNVAAAIALERPACRVVAVDCSRKALGVAGRNLVRQGVHDRVGLVCAEGLAPVGGRFDAIVSNPPYVPTGELAGLAPELAHEPRVALDGGPDGLVVLRRLVEEAPSRLAPGGRLLLEVGAGQAPAVRELARAAGAEVELHRDLAGIERVVVARFQGEASCQSRATC